MIETAGAAVVAITPEGPDMAAKIKNDMQLPWLILSDPQLEVIRAFGLFHEDEPKGRAIPYPATYLIGRDGIVKWRYIGRDTRDRPKPPDLKAALQELEYRSD